MERKKRKEGPRDGIKEVVRRAGVWRQSKEKIDWRGPDQTLTSRLPTLGIFGEVGETNQTG